MNIPYYITRPGRYIGIETNRVIKEPQNISVRFALCYPDIYEVGMSYYGYFLLYELANTVDRVWCERCFAPWHDMEMYLRKNNIPLTTLESHTPLSDMDIVGFSLTYELNVTNVLNMLTLGGIPIHSHNRDRHPIVVAGGPLMMNPKPFERFFDLIVIGEGEHAVLQILEMMKALKGENRITHLKSLSAIDGVYVPLVGKSRVTRLFVKNLDTAYNPVRPPIPVVGSIHNRLNIEISRGCGNGCRFCFAGFIYRPYRERSFSNIIELIERGIKNTGFEDISLLSLSSGDHSNLYNIISYIQKTYKGVSVSLPSLKIGSLKEDEIDSIGTIARTGLTFALEAISPFIRTRINKHIDIDALVRNLSLLRRLGWRRIKLYYMVGFPWDDDIVQLKEFVLPFEKEGIDITLSISPFVPKPHTPFQWLPVEDETILNEKIRMIKRILKGRRVRVKYRDIATSITEGIISRGDNRLSDLFEFLVEKGAKLEAWREFFKPELYTEWFERTGIRRDEYLQQRGFDETLPWDFIDTGVQKSYLQEELHKAYTMHYTPDCYAHCAACGLRCNGTMKSTAMDDQPIEHSTSTINLQTHAPEVHIKYTFRYGKYGDARYIGHLDIVNILLRAFRSCGISIRTHGKYHPMPRISLSEALPVGIESTCELIEIETDIGVLVYDTIIEEINSKLPNGVKIIEFIKGSMSNMVRGNSYILIADHEVDMLLWRTEKKKERYFYIWKGKGIKDLWAKGMFTRIIKIEDRRIHGIRTDY